MGSGSGTIWVLALVTMPGVSQTHVMQPADLANLRTVEAPRVSPDGRLVVYTVTTPTLAGKPRNQHIWLAGTGVAGTGLAGTGLAGAARPFVAGAGTDASPAWSPDGKHIAFLSDRHNPLDEAGSAYRFSVAPGRAPQPPEGLQTVPQKPLEPAAPPAAEEAVGADAKEMQLWWIAVDGGEAEPLTNLPGGVRSFQWSKDGREIGFVHTDQDSRAEADRKKQKNDESVLDQGYHYDRLWVLDLALHQARQLSTGARNIDTLDWSPDGRAIVSRVSPTPRLDDYWRVSKVIVFDAETGEQKKVLEENSGYQTPEYSPDGSQIFYSRFTRTRITDEHFIEATDGGPAIKLEDRLKGTIAQMRWLPDGHLFVNAYVGAHTEALDLDTRKMVAAPLAGLPATALDFDMTRDGRVKVFLGETPAQPGEVWVSSAGKLNMVTDTNPQVKQWSLGTEREVSWENPSDHHMVYGVLSLPPGYREGQRSKTLIHLHGGPEEAFTVGFNANWYNYAALFASQGYVVLQPNYRGSAGQEVAFTEGDQRAWGDRDYRDVMAGVDWLEHAGIADPGRLAIAGWSFGGFLTSWAVTHTDRFKVAMAGAAITDVFSMALTTDIAPSYVSSYLGPLNAASYDRDSAVRFAAACHTPVLVLHGQADVRVPLSQGQEFYHALRALGKDTEMVTYPREPHIFSEREHQIDSLARELAWFDRYLHAPGIAAR